MKATPTGRSDPPGGRPGLAPGRELALDRAGFASLEAALRAAVPGLRLAASCLLAGALAIGLASRVPGGPAALLLVAPVAFAVGAVWGQALVSRKLSELGTGLGTGRALPVAWGSELAGAGLLLALLVCPPFPAAAGLAAFLVAAAGASTAYAHRAAGLADAIGATRGPPAARPESAGAGEVLVLGSDAAGPGNCPVCGESIGAAPEPWRCPRCATGHHVECHRYARGCAVFGCTGPSPPLA